MCLLSSTREDQGKIITSFSTDSHFSQDLKTAMVYAGLVSFPKGKTCSLCNTNTVDRLTLGDIYKIADIVVHYFCLLLASKGEQKGTDRQGLLGFLLKDIKKEIKRGSRIKCTYCQRKGATVICAKGKCKTNFHLPCGLKENSLHFFCNEFKSFCVKHRSKNVIPTSLKKTIIENQVCILCFTPINLKDMFNLIWPPCCKPPSLQHKQCVQKMAYTSGYYFKCPFCSNIKKFNKYIRESGIFIPEQEATWEREPRAYSDYRVELRCVAEPCICPKGNFYCRNKTKWNLKSCITCGGNAIHSGCFKKLKLSDIKIYWQCSDCIPSITDHTTSSAVDSDSTYVSSSCNNMDDACMLADENASEQEENEDYESRVGMDAVEKRGQFVTTVDLERCRDNNNDEKLVLFVDGFLNETLKVDSNVVEVIANNKRCIVSLSKLNNDALVDGTLTCE